MKNKTGFIIAGLTILAIIIAAVVFFTPKNNAESELLNTSINPETNITGITLSNMGALNPNDTNELNFTQNVSFQNNGLSSRLGSTLGYVLTPNEDFDLFAQTVGTHVNVDFSLQNLYEETNIVAFFLGFDIDGHEHSMTLNNQPYRITEWEYIQSKFAAANANCLDLETPQIFKFLTISEEEFFAKYENVFEVENLSLSEKAEIFDMEQYNLAVEEYEKACPTVESLTNTQKNAAKTSAENFLQALGVQTGALSYTHNIIDSTEIFPEQSSGNYVETKIAYNIGGKKGHEMFTFLTTLEGEIVKASGYYYNTPTTVNISVMTPEESLKRTERGNRILGSINPSYYETYKILTTYSEEGPKTVALNSQEEITVFVSTNEGIIVLPGYILYNSETMEAIYVVAADEKNFMDGRHD